jgi:hypothetical protein
MPCRCALCAHLSGVRSCGLVVMSRGRELCILRTVSDNDAVHTSDSQFHVIETPGIGSSATAVSSATQPACSRSARKYDMTQGMFARSIHWPLPVRPSLNTRTSIVSVGALQFGGCCGIVTRVIESRARRDLYFFAGGCTGPASWESSDDAAAAALTAFSISSRRVKSARSLRVPSVPATDLYSQHWPLLSRTNVYFTVWLCSSMSSTSLVSIAYGRLRYPPVIMTPGRVTISDHGVLGGDIDVTMRKRGFRRRALELICRMLKKYLVVVTTYFRLGENILSWGQHISGWGKISCPVDKIFPAGRKYLVLGTRYFRLGENILSWRQDIFGSLFGLGSAQGRAAAENRAAGLGWAGLR